jgi:hypothetical protein
MKKFLLSVAVGLVLFSIHSCTKDTGEEAQKKKAEEFRNTVKNKRYRLVDFYSDLPIDYIENDTIVRSETDLRGYIKPYLPDDENLFDSTGLLLINQGANRIPGNDSLILNRRYLLKWNATDASIDFVDYFYIPSNYKIFDYTPDHFTIYLNWPKGGAKLYSRFAIIP